MKKKPLIIFDFHETITKSRFFHGFDSEEDKVFAEKVVTPMDFKAAINALAANGVHIGIASFADEQADKNDYMYNKRLKEGANALLPSDLLTGQKLIRKVLKVVIQNDALVDNIKFECWRDDDETNKIRHEDNLIKAIGKDEITDTILFDDNKIIIKSHLKQKRRAVLVLNKMTDEDQNWPSILENLSENAADENLADLIFFKALEQNAHHYFNLLAEIISDPELGNKEKNDVFQWLANQDGGSWLSCGAPSDDSAVKIFNFLINNQDLSSLLFNVFRGFSFADFFYPPINGQFNVKIPSGELEMPTYLLDIFHQLPFEKADAILKNLLKRITPSDHAKFINQVFLKITRHSSKNTKFDPVPFVESYINNGIDIKFIIDKSFNERSFNIVALATITKFEGPRQELTAYLKQYNPKALPSLSGLEPEKINFLLEFFEYFNPECRLKILENSGVSLSSFEVFFARHQSLRIEKNEQSYLLYDICYLILKILPRKRDESLKVFHYLKALLDKNEKFIIYNQLANIATTEKSSFEKLIFEVGTNDAIRFLFELIEDAQNTADMQTLLERIDLDAILEYCLRTGRKFLLESAYRLSSFVGRPFKLSPQEQLHYLGKTGSQWIQQEAVDFLLEAHLAALSSEKDPAELIAIISNSGQPFLIATLCKKFNLTIAQEVFFQKCEILNNRFLEGPIKNAFIGLMHFIEKPLSIDLLEKIINSNIAPEAKYSLATLILNLLKTQNANLSLYQKDNDNKLSLASIFSTHFRNEALRAIFLRAIPDIGNPLPLFSKAHDVVEKELSEATDKVFVKHTEALTHFTVTMSELWQVSDYKVFKDRSRVAELWKLINEIHATISQSEKICQQKKEKKGYASASFEKYQEQLKKTYSLLFNILATVCSMYPNDKETHEYINSFFNECTKKSGLHFSANVNSNNFWPVSIVQPCSTETPELRFLVAAYKQEKFSALHYLNDMYEQSHDKVLLMAGIRKFGDADILKAYLKLSLPISPLYSVVEQFIKEKNIESIILLSPTEPVMASLKGELGIFVLIDLLFKIQPLDPMQANPNNIVSIKNTDGCINLIEKIYIEMLAVLTHNGLEMHWNHPSVQRLPQTKAILAAVKEFDPSISIASNLNESLSAPMNVAPHAATFSQQSKRKPESEEPQNDNTKKQKYEP